MLRGARLQRHHHPRARPPRRRHGGRALPPLPEQGIALRGHDRGEDGSRGAGRLHGSLRAGRRRPRLLPRAGVRDLPTHRGRSGSAADPALHRAGRTRIVGALLRLRVRRVREFISEYVARRVAEGAFRAVDPVLAARAFLGMVLDHIHVRRIYGQADAYPQPLDEVAATFADIFLGGVQRGREAVDR